MAKKGATHEFASRLWWTTTRRSGEDNCGKNDRMHDDVVFKKNSKTVVGLSHHAHACDADAWAQLSPHRARLSKTLGENLGCKYMPVASDPAYMTLTQPSVDIISKSVRRALAKLSKFWLSTGIHFPPCSWHSAASLISGSQKSEHWHCASHSLLHAWHFTLLRSVHASQQKFGWILQSALHCVFFSSFTSPGQKASLQLTAAAAGGVDKTPRASTVVPPHGMTNCRVS
mmetsp:Transcript_92029/g.296018  ORF Transcript_92029/g.296018 Transcript_92029/m.296018 type:complete len:229 (-) Transcript_92029:2802-3488(-)